MPITNGYDPATLSPNNVPSFAEELPDRVVLLSHPSNDANHPSLIAAVKRYRAKGWLTSVQHFIPRAA